MSWFTRLRCWLGRHPSLVVVQKFTHYSRRIGCPHCGRSYGMNDSVRIVLPWDCELEGFYEGQGHVIKPWGAA